MNNFVATTNPNDHRELDASRLPIITPLSTFRRFRDDEIARPLLESELESMIPRIQLHACDGVYFYFDELACEGWPDVYPTQRVFYQTWSDPIEAVMALVVRDVAGLEHL